MGLMDEFGGAGDMLSGLVTSLSRLAVMVVVIAVIGVMVYFVGWRLGAFKTPVYILEKIGTNAFVISKDKQGKVGKKYQKTLKLLKGRQEIIDFDEREVKVYTKKGKRARMIRKFGDEYFPIQLKDNIEQATLEIHTLPSDIVSFRVQKIIEFESRYKSDDWKKTLLDIAIPVAFGVLILVFMIMYKEEVVASLGLLREAIQLGGELAKQNAQVMLPIPPG